jgi:hypothetical protein
MKGISYRKMAKVFVPHTDALVRDPDRQAYILSGSEKETRHWLPEPVLYGRRKGGKDYLGNSEVVR